MLTIVMYTCIHIILTACNTFMQTISISMYYYWCYKLLFTRSASLEY